ncbi:MAG: nucleotidyl transferase AbiEii/AbiGii toxin family protein [Janthinobacterium lividum]
MPLTPTRHREMLALEGFIRRAATLPDLPFMLKGSYVTRQYFERPTDRIPGDLDWVYTDRITSAEQAREVFGDWVTRITDLVLDDGITFRSFRENAFWRLVDYAMDDDFPTVNTDLEYQVDGGEMTGFSLDISFNLPLPAPAVPLHYPPLRGLLFTVPHTAPLSLQVAWKLHQSLVRPRFKDLFDLLHLLQHWGFTAQVREQALAALAQECRADGTDPARLQWLLAGHLEPLFAKESLPVNEQWKYWRYGQVDPNANANANAYTYRPDPACLYYNYNAGYIMPDPAVLPPTLVGFGQQLRAAFAAAGFEQTPPDKSGSLDALRKFFTGK